MLIGSYAKQTSSGIPLISNGQIDMDAVKQLAYFDIVTLEATPFAMDTDGNGKGEIPLLLRKLNPDIQIFLYLLVGDQWLPPAFPTKSNDKSAFARIYNAVDLTDGWLYGIDGKQWYPNYRVDLGHT